MAPAIVSTLELGLYVHQMQLDLEYYRTGKWTHELDRVAHRRLNLAYDISRFKKILWNDLGPEGKVTIVRPPSPVTIVVLFGCVFKDTAYLLDLLCAPTALEFLFVFHDYAPWKGGQVSLECAIDPFIGLRSLKGIELASGLQGGATLANASPLSSELKLASLTTKLTRITINYYSWHLTLVACFYPSGQDMSAHFTWCCCGGYYQRVQSAVAWRILDPHPQCPKRLGRIEKSDM
jgi:hypothetical protein